MFYIRQTIGDRHPDTYIESGAILNRVTTQAGSQGSTQPAAKQKFLFRDGLAFVVLTLVSLALYGVTLSLFRSFESHRQGLAEYWSDRGKQEMQGGQSKQGAESLRKALSYAPDNRGYELLLAEALSDAGQADQATNYFLNLWESQPGDGFINLELARLARGKKDTQRAVTYYRASIFGDWRGDGPTRRRSIRLELADYLASLHQFDAARDELMIASGNAAVNQNINLTLGDKFAAIGDVPDALNSYKKAAVDDPHDQVTLEKAGRLSFQVGNFDDAFGFLDDALKEGISDEGDRQQLAAMAQQAQQLIKLSLSRELPPGERIEHLLLAKTIAQARLTACLTRSGAAAQQSATLQNLKERWEVADSDTQSTMEQVPTLQDSLSNLVMETELVTAKECGPPTGDDALLMILAKLQNASH
jgi:tetratricopeptide (TPR) repeat protein